MSTVRIGVVGVGYLGRFHAEKYAAMPDVELFGIMDADQERAASLAASLGTRVVHDPSAFFSKVDAVSIVVPTVLHHRLAKVFLENGVHVLVEKPITVTLEQADELIELAEKRCLIIQVGHIERFNPAVTAVRSLLKRPRYLTAERSAPFTVRCTDVNVVLDLMIHDLDLVTDIAGSAPKEVSAAGATVITREIDIATARIVFENGCVADVTASRVSDEKQRILRIFDDSSVYTCNFQSQMATFGRRNTDGVPALIAQDIPTERRDTLDDELRAFVRSVRDGVRPLVSAREGRQALALAQTITRCIEGKVTGFVPVAKKGA